MQDLGTASATGIGSGKLWTKSGGFVPGAAFLAKNPEFATQFAKSVADAQLGTITPPDSAKIKGTSKLLASLNQWGDISAGTIKGLKQPHYGRELAKIQAMGDITNLDAVSSKTFSLSALGKIPGFVPFIGGLTAAAVVIKGFTSAIQGAKSAIQSAFSLYTGAAQQGLSTQFFARRQTLAGMLGVQGNPNNVFYFGKAIEELDKRIGSAVKTISNNARPLAETEMNAKILKLDLEALSSRIAVNLLPAINAWINTIDALSKIQPPEWMKMAARAAVFAAVPSLNAIALITQGLIKGGLGSSGLQGMGQLSIMAKQLPASQWEHMGLVIGGNFQSRALDYQRRAAVGIERLVHSVSAQAQKNSNSYYLNQNPFVAAP